MPTLPSFQTLPLLIVELIVDYVVGGSRLQLTRMSTGKLTTARLLQPLLSVCHSFHAAVQPRIFNRYVLDISTPDNQTDIRNTTQSTSNGPSAHLVAKALEITINLPCIFSGRALEMLSRAPYDSCVLPAVRSLTITCCIERRPHQEDSAIDPAMASANTTAFLQRLRQMAPRAHKLVVFGHDARDWPPRIVHDFRVLVSEILPTVDQFEYYTGLKKHSMIPNFDGVCNLVRINYTLDVSTNAFFQLARQCARSLRSLSLGQFLGLSEPIDISGLIQYPGGGYVEYPLLQKLNLMTLMHPNSVQRATFAGAVPFPILRDLRIMGDYPFGDDTPFRGNAATLERLYLTLSPSMANALKENRVFTYTSHPQLQRVTVRKSSGIVPNCFATEMDCLRFMLGIGPGASARVVSCITYIENTPHVLSLFAEHTSIQILELSNILLTLWDVIALIKSLPLLSELATAEPHIGARPVGHRRPQLTKYVIDHYLFVSERFRSWSFITGEHQSDSAKCVLLLALVCPNFDYVVPNLRGDTRRLVSELKELIAIKAYKKHEQRFQRLLDSLV
ncbi:hypothetical protein GGF42_001781 [Coemansia sp. RSA 2424]|nr:hypothetical protein GGF42_001781 [Coemansia sp. RSA 2424]